MQECPGRTLLMLGGFTAVMLKERSPNTKPGTTTVGSRGPCPGCKMALRDGGAIEKTLYLFYVGHNRKMTAILLILVIIQSE